MEKKRPLSDVWTPTKGLESAFDYHPPDSKNAVMGPPKASRPEEVPTWNEFTQSTTIHGVKYIFDPSTHNKFRRIFWIFVCVTVMIYFIVQLTTSIIKYYEYGTTTDVQVIYGESVLFPAVTLCNQNNFRTTATAKFHLYDYIDDIFSKSEDFDDSEDDWESVNTTEFINDTAHQLQDFVDSCTWSGKDCNVAADFVKIFTGIGVCYTFNGGKNPRTAFEPGSSTGLSLVLNVEQYEYMRGPNSDAGIKVLLHDPADKPDMKDQGFVVAPGTHTLVTILQRQVTSLPPPWGTCVKGAVAYQTCRSECRDLKVAKKCGCRDVYMSELDEAPAKYCNMNESFICIRNAEEVIQQQKNDCNCSVTCDRTLFEPTLSYAMLSEFNIDQVALTTEAKKDAVKVKFETAMETQQRVVDTIRDADERSMKLLVDTARNLALVLNETYTNCTNTTTLSEIYRIPDVLTDDQSYPQEDVAYAKQHSNEIKEEKEKKVEIDFKQAKTQLNKFLETLFDYYEGESWILETIQHCRAEGLTGNTEVYCNNPPPPAPPNAIVIDCQEWDIAEDVCSTQEFVKYLYDDVPDENEAEQEAIHTFTKLQDYIDAVNWTFAYQTLDETEYADHYTCQENLAFYQNTILPAYISFTQGVGNLYNVSTLEDIETGLTGLQTILDDTLGPHLLENDTEKRWTYSHGMGNMNDHGSHSNENNDDEKSDAESLKCSWYGDIYKDEIEPFERQLGPLETKVSTNHNTLRTKFSALVEQLLKVLEHYNDELAEPVSKIRSYLDEEITKKELAEVLSDQELTRTNAELSTMNTDLTTAVKVFEAAFRNFPTTLNEFYEQLTEKKFPYISDQTKANYPFLEEQMSWYNNLGGKELIEQHLTAGGELNGRNLPANTVFTEQNIWKALSIAVEGSDEDGVTRTGLQVLTSTIKEEITNPIKRLLTQLDAIIMDMNDYKDKISMNTDFYMKNFLQLDIFYKELSYDTIEQQKAFKFESLLGEVGGFLGLLLGASVVTLCELLDYIVMHCLAGCKRRKRNDVKSFNNQMNEQHTGEIEKKPVTNFGMYQ